MNLASLLAEIQQALPGHETPRVISALRVDPIIWEGLQNPDLINRAIIYCGDNPAKWNPGNIALLALSRPYNLSELTPSLVDAIDARQDPFASEKYDEYIQNPNIITSIEDSGLLALAIREKYKQQNSWEGLIENIKSSKNDNNKFLALQTPLTCVYGMVENSSELLWGLISGPLSEEKLKLVTHILLSNPLEEETRIKLVLEMMDAFSIGQQVAWLKLFSQKGYTKLAAQLAKRKLIEDPAVEDRINRDLNQLANDAECGIKAISDLHHLANIFEFSGDKEKAIKLLNKASGELRYILAGINVQTIQINPLDESAKTAIEETKNFIANNPDAKNIQSEIVLIGELSSELKNIKKELVKDRDHPFAQICQAAWLADDGEKAQGQAVAKSAVATIIGSYNDNGIDLSDSNLINWEPYRLINLLVDLDLPDDALRLAMLLLRNRPSDEKIIDLAIELLKSLGDNDNAIILAQVQNLLIPEDPDSIRQLANLWETFGEWGKSFQQRDALVKLLPKLSVDDWLNYARSAYNANEHRYALDGCVKILEEQAEHPEATSILGKTLSHLGKREEAIKYLKKAVIIWPEDIENWLLLAEVQRQTGEIENCLETLYSAVKSNPEEVEFHRQIADVWTKLQDWDKTLIHRTKVVKIATEPKLSDWQDLASSAFNSHNFHLALEGCNKVIENDPENGLANSIFGRSLYLSGNPEKAQIYLEKAIRLEPRIVDNWLYLAEILVKNNDSQRSLEILTSALNFFPEDVNLHRAIAKLFEDQGHWESSLKHHRRIFSLNPQSDNDELISYGKSALRNNEPREAIDVISNILTTSSENGQANSIMGQALGYLGENDEAVKYLNKAVVLAPEIPESWLMLAGMQKQAGETKRGLETLRSAVLACPNSAQINLALAEESLNLGLTSEALPFLRQASKLAPEAIEAAIQLGRALHSLGLFEEGRQCLKMARQKWPQNPGLAMMHAKILLASGASEEALQALDVVLQTGRPDIETYLLYVNALLGEQSPILNPKPPELAKLLNAQQVLDKALTLQADHFLFGILMAEILAVKGEIGAAFSRYQQLVDHPESSRSEFNWRLLAGFGKVALMMNEVETALAVLKEAVQAQPENVILKQLLAEAYSKADLVNESFMISRGVLKLSPDNLETLVWFATIAAKSGEISAAEEALKCATELDPNKAENWLMMAELQQRSGENEDVKKTLKSLLNIDHLTIEEWRKVALIFTRLGDHAAGLSCLEQSLDSTTQSSTQILFEIACLQKAMGDLEAALYNIQKAIEIFPDQIALHIFEADILVGLGRPQAAVACLEKALSIQEISNNEGVSDTRNNTKTPLVVEILSEKWFSQSLSSQSGVHIRFAHILRQLGNLSLALYHAEKAVELSPTSLAYCYLAVDLALAFLQEERAKNILSSMESVVSNDRSFGEQINEIYAALLGVKSEIAFEDGDEALVEKILAEGLTIFPKNQRLLAVKTRLSALRGEVIEAEENYKTLLGEITLGVTEAQVELVEDFDSYDLVNYWQRARNIWLAECLLDIQYWKAALDLFETIALNAKAEARANLRYARALVISVEKERLYQELGCLRHKPDSDVLNKRNQEKLDNALMAAWKVSSSKEVKRWEARGAVAFDLTAQAIHTLDRESENIEDKAMITAALRQSGSHQAAIGIALRLPETEENAMQQALSHYYDDGVRGLEAAHRGALARPNDPVYQAVLAHLAEKMDQHDIALQAIETALSIWEDEPGWHAWAGRLSEMFGGSSEIVHWQQATSLNPLNVDYALALGRIYLKYNETSKAIEVLDNASRIDNENINIWQTLSTSHQLAGHFDQAFTCAQQAVKLAPSLPSPLVQCGQISLIMGKYDLGYQYAREALTLDPRFVDAILLISEVLVRQNKIKEALQVVESAPEDIKNDFKVLYTKAILARGFRNTQDVLLIVKDLAEKYPDHPVALALLAHVLLEQGDLKNAEIAAQSSLKYQPEQPELNLLMGRLLKKSGQLDQAIHYLSETIIQAPLNFDAYQELGETYQERREYLQALRVYKQGIKALPGEHRLYFSAALIMREVKNYIGAETMLRKASELAPDDVNIRRQLGAVIALNLVHNPQEASSNL